jgi:hypothetical protein
MNGDNSKRDWGHGRDHDRDHGWGRAGELGAALNDAGEEAGAGVVWLTPGQVVQLLRKVGAAAPNPETIRDWVKTGRIDGAFTRGGARRRGDARCPSSQPGAGHGTHNRYRQGCRCGPCTEANRRYLEGYRERHGQRSAPRRRTRERDEADAALLLGGQGAGDGRYARGTTLDELLGEW